MIVRKCFELLILLVLVVGLVADLLADESLFVGSEDNEPSALNRPLLAGETYQVTVPATLDLAERARPFFEAAGVPTDDRLAAAVETVQARAKNLVDLVAASSFFFVSAVAPRARKSRQVRRREFRCLTASLAAPSRKKRMAGSATYATA